MSIIKNLEAQAKDLRAILASAGPELEKLTASLPSLQAAYEAACGEQGKPAPEADGLGLRLNQMHSRIGELTRDRQDATVRLREVEALIESGPRIVSARAAQATARTTVVTARKKVDDIQAAVERLRPMPAVEAGFAEASRAHALHDVLAGLGGLEGFGPESARPPEPSAPLLAPEIHQQRAQAYSEALVKAEAQADHHGRELLAAQDALKRADADLMAAMVVGAELEHAQALAAYLPVFAKYRAGHQLAHSWYPGAPDLDSLALPSSDELCADFRASVENGDGAATKRKGGLAWLG